MGFGCPRPPVRNDIVTCDMFTHAQKEPEPVGRVSTSSRTYGSTAHYGDEKSTCLNYFELWTENEQIDFVEHLLSRMCHYQHGHINQYLKPMLQRDFISALPGRIVFEILAFLHQDASVSVGTTAKSFIQHQMARRVLAALIGPSIIFCSDP